MARGTQHRKRRPQANARVARRAAGRRRSRSASSTRAGRTSSSSRGCATTRKWVFVLLAVVFARQLRPPRRRLRLDRHQPIVLRTSSAARSASGTSLSVAPEEDGRAPEERRGLARLATQAPAGRASSTRRPPRSRPTSTLKPKDEDALRAARRALPPPRPRTGRRSTPCQQQRDAGARAEPDARPRSRARRSARRSARSRARSRARSPPARARPRATPTSSSRPPSRQREDAYKKLAALDPEGRHHAALARPGRAGRRRHARPRSRPTRRSSSSRRTTPAFRRPRRR